jgi:hypothetical protein
VAAKDRTSGQPPPDPGVGQPPPTRSSDILLTEIAKLQSDGEHLRRDLTETRADMKDIRDRMARLEVRVDHLPSKGFIVAVVTSALLIVSAIATIAPRLWGSAAGTTPPISALQKTFPE